MTAVQDEGSSAFDRSISPQSYPISPPRPFSIPKNRSAGNLLSLDTKSRADVRASQSHGDTATEADALDGSEPRSPSNQAGTAISPHDTTQQQARWSRFTSNAEPALSRVTSMPFTIPSPVLSCQTSNPAELAMSSSFGGGEDLARFTSESLHSFSFANQSDDSSYARHSILKRSIDFLREKTGWTGGNRAIATTHARMSEDPEMQSMVDLLSRANVLKERHGSGEIIRPGGPLTGPAQMPSDNIFEKSFAVQTESPTPIPLEFGSDGQHSAIDEPDGMLTPTQGVVSVTVDPPAQSVTRSRTDPPLSFEPEMTAPKSKMRRTFTDIAALSLQSKLTDALAQPYTATGSGLLSPVASSASVNTPATPMFPSQPSHSHARAAPSTQAIFTTDATEPWTMVAANDLSCLLFGISKAELRKMSILEVFREEKREWLAQKLRASRAQSPPLKARPISLSPTASSPSMGNGVTARLLQKAPARETGEGRPSRRGGARIAGGKDMERDGQNTQADRGVILCGDVLPTQKRNGSLGSVTLWVQQKRDSLIWVLEEVAEDVALLDMDEVGCVVKATGQCEAVWGMERVRRGMDITRLIPGIPRLKGTSTGALDFDEIAKMRRYTARTANDISIPVTVDQLSGQSAFRVSSFPNIAGMLILSSSTLKVTNSNPVITEALFGRIPDGLPISDFIPDFDLILDYLKQEDRIQLIDGVIIPEYSFRRARAMIALREGKDDAAAIFLRPSGLPAIHRDGAEIMVDIQLRVARSSPIISTAVSGVGHDKENCLISPDGRVTETVYALWVTYSKVLHAVNHGVGPVSPLISRPSTPPRQPTPGDNVPALSDDSDSDREHGIDKLRSPGVEPHPLPSTPMTATKTTTQKRLIDDYTILEDMGAGAYGQVKLARLKPSAGAAVAASQDASATGMLHTGELPGINTTSKVVIKYVFKSRILVDTWTRDRRLGTVPLEIHVLDYLSHHFPPHPNIIRMSGFFEDTVNYYILMVPHGLPGMDLFDYIELRSEMTEDECKAIFVQVAEGVRFLHEDAKVVHRDIKDENVILNGEGRIKIIDFGSASYTKNGPFEVFVGTIDYAAPEVLAGTPYSGLPQDVWALGILLYTILYKENPFYSPDEITDRDLRVPYVVSDASIALVRRMLERDVDRRISVGEVLSDAWCTNGTAKEIEPAAVEGQARRLT